MKKFFTLLMTVLTFGSVIVSCSDKDADAVTPENPSTPETPVTPTPTETADYTIIFWGMAGQNDICASVDLATLAYNYQQGKIGKNVQIAGLMKTSVAKAYEKEGVDPAYDKTWYFDSETIGTTPVPESDTEILNKEVPATKIQKFYKEAFDNLNGKEYGDTLYPLSNTDSLANFIKKAAEKFPAHHYVLLLFGHGNGFSPVDDTPATRGCVYDEFMTGGVTADGVVSAVNKSGVKMQTIFTQCCLMGTLENMAAYSQVFDYGILSAEPTLGFYFPQYLVNLSQAGNDETKMQEQSRKLVDYYADTTSPKVFPSFNTSHGFYDLKKTGTLLAATKKAAEWYATNYAKDEYKDAIDKALASSLVCIDLLYMLPYEGSTELYEVRQMMQSILKEGTEIKDNDEFVTAVKRAAKLLGTIAGNPHTYCMADVMKKTLGANLPADKIAALKSIYDEYMAALKDMAYIRTTNKPATADANYEYEYASPTLDIFSMNPDYFIPVITSEMEQDELCEELRQALEDNDMEKAQYIGHQLLEGTYFANNGHTLSEVKGNYTASVFDKQVGWSKFLEQLQFTPSLAICPDRSQVNEEYEE